MTAECRAIARSLLLVLLVFASSASYVSAAPVGLIARGGEAGRFWLVVADEDKDKAITTSVRYLAEPIANRWAEATRFTGRVIDAAPVASRLAVLFEDGTWRMAWDGGSLTGPVPPEGYTLRHFASAGDVLWAAAATNTSGSLLRWTESEGWSVIASLPEDLHDYGDAKIQPFSLAVYGGTPWLSYVNGDRHYVISSFAVGNGQWHAEATTASFTSFNNGGEEGHARLLPGGTRPLVMTVSEMAGDYMLSVWKLEDFRPRQAPFEPLCRTMVNSKAPFDAAVIGPSIRYVMAIEPKPEAGLIAIGQTTIDNYGRGSKFGPDPIPDPAPPTPRPQNEWLNLLVLTGLTVLMLRTIRGEPEAVEPVLPAGLRPAPRGRRVLAGLIDALPLIVVAGVVFARFEGSAEALKNTPTQVYLPMFLGVLVYLGHVTAGELLFRKSFGKWLFSLRVVSIDGTPATAERIVLRNLLRLVEIAFGLPLALPLWMPGGQRLGDLAAKTIVVGKSPPTELESDDPAAG